MISNFLVENMQSSQPLATPRSTANKIPAGHVVANDKWRGTELARHLQAKANVLFEEDNSVVDFYPSTGTAVVYITEGDLVAGNMYRRRLAKLRKANSLRGIVLVEKTKTSSQYFQPVQKFAVQEIGLFLLPVENQEQAAGLLYQMAQVEQRPQNNPFLIRPKSQQLDVALLATVKTIPRLGEVKAQALLQTFHSIQGICEASENELAKVVGKNIATEIRKVFHSPP